MAIAQPSLEPKTRYDLVSYLDAQDETPSYEQLVSEGYGDVLTPEKYQRLLRDREVSEANRESDSAWRFNVL